MTGSLQIKNDKYYLVMNIYDQGGKRKQKWFATGLTAKGNKKREEKLLRDKENELEHQASAPPGSDMLFSDAIQSWFIAVSNRVDEVTMQGYEALAYCHIIPYFAATGIKLAEVTRPILQRYLDEKHTSGRMDGQGGLAPASIRLHKNILYQTLKEAVLNELIPANPCEYVKLPQARPYKGRFYSIEQINQLFTAIADEPLFPLIRMTALYGLRRSEVLGLK